MLETGILQLAAVVALNAAFQGPFNAGQMHGAHAEIIDDTSTVEFRCRLHQPSKYELEECLILDPAETQTLPRRTNHLNQQPRGLPSHGRTSSGWAATRMVAEVQHRLPLSELLASDKHQRRQLDLRMNRTKMLQNPALAMLLLHNLHRHRPRRGLHLTQKRTHTPILNQVLRGGFISVGVLG